MYVYISNSTLPKNAIFRLSNPWSRDGQGQDTF